MTQGSCSLKGSTASDIYGNCLDVDGTSSWKLDDDSSCMAKGGT
jgi:hypothetical protein